MKKLFFILIFLLIFIFQPEYRVCFADDLVLKDQSMMQLHARNRKRSGKRKKRRISGRTNAYGSDRNRNRVGVSFAPISLLYTNINAEIEFNPKIMEKHFKKGRALAGGSFYSNKSRNLDLTFSTTMISLMLGYKYYLTSFPFNDSWIVKGLLSVGFTNFSYLEDSASGVTLGASILGGYHWQWDNLYVELCPGLTYYLGGVSIGRYSSSYIGASLVLGFNVGWAF